MLMTLYRERPEELAGVRERLDQRIYLVLGVVQVEARPRRRRDAEPAHQRLGAVVAAPYRDPLVVQDLGEVMGVNVRQREGDEPHPVLLRTVYRDALDLRESPVSVLSQPPLVLPHVLHADPAQIIHRNAETDGLSDVHRPGLELVG